LAYVTPVISKVTTGSKKRARPAFFKPGHGVWLVGICHQPDAVALQLELSEGLFNTRVGFDVLQLHIPEERNGAGIDIRIRAGLVLQEITDVIRILKPSLSPEKVGEELFSSPAPEEIGYCPAGLHLCGYQVKEGVVHIKDDGGERGRLLRHE